MSIVSRDREVTVISLGTQYDSLDDPTIRSLEKVLLEQAATAQPPRVVLDFASTRFMGSVFIEVVVRVWKRLRDRQGELALCNLNGFCKEVLERTQLNRLWRVYPSRQAAVDALAELGS